MAITMNQTGTGNNISLIRGTAVAVTEQATRACLAILFACHLLCTVLQVKTSLWVDHKNSYSSTSNENTTFGLLTLSEIKQQTIEE